MTHLFGVKYADELRRYGRSDLESIAVAAGATASQATEISKGIKLAEYVNLK